MAVSMLTLYAGVQTLIDDCFVEYVALEDRLNQRHGKSPLKQNELIKSLIRLAPPRRTSKATLNSLFLII